MKILEQMVVFNSDTAFEDVIYYLNDEVNRYIEDGWQPLGPMQFAVTSDDNLYKYRAIQTLVKYGEGK